MTARRQVAETWFQRWTWLIYEISGAAWLTLGLTAIDTGPTWYVVFMSVIGPVMLIGAVVEFRAHRKRVAP